MSVRARPVRALGLVKWCWVLWLAAVAAAFPAHASEHEKLVIAHLDGQPVTGEAFAPYLRAYLRSKLYHAGSPERVRELADEAIDAFLIDKVLAQQAVARGVKIDQAAVDKRLADIKDKFSSRPEWPDISARMPKLREEIEKDLRIEALKGDISRGDPVTEADARAYYEGHPELFTRPAAYRLKLLLVGVDPGAGSEAWHAGVKQAEDYARRIAAGEDFAALARAHSKHSSAEKGGAIGLVHEGQLGEAAEAALRATKPGGVAGPVRLLEGIALFAVEEKTAKALLAFSEVKERAVSLAERDGAKKRWDAHLEAIRGRFSIEKAVFATFVASATR